MDDEYEIVEIDATLEELLEAGSESEDNTFETEPYVAPTPEETIEWLRGVWDKSFEPVYTEMHANGNYWSAGMQIEAHNQYIRDHLDSMVRSGVLSDDEAERLYREIEQ